MPPARPILDEIELEHVQHLDVEEEDVAVQQSVPALEGDFVQRLNRRAARVTLRGIFAGPEARDNLKKLRDKFRAGEPVTFVADATTATRVGDVLIKDLETVELAGKPERYEYALALREFIAPPQTPSEEVLPDASLAEAVSEDGQERTEEVVSQIAEDQGDLAVQVEFDSGQPDFSNLQVLVEGTSDTGDRVRFAIEEQTNGLYSRQGIPAGEYTVSVFRS
jgi:hypothetical protein